MILNIIHKFLEDNHRATFSEIFSHVRLLLESKWKRNFGDEMPIEKILAKKRGELFGYLNTDGRFIMINDTQWSLTHQYSYDEIRKLRAISVQNSEL